MLRLAGLGIVVAALAAAGCGGSGGDGTPEPSPAAVVRQSAERTGELRSFHFRLDVEGVPKSRKGLQLTGAEGDVRVPDRLRAEVSGTFAGFPLATSLVAAGGKLWIENPLGGSWERIAVGTTPAFLLDPQKGVLGVMRDVTQTASDGSDDVDGTKTLRFTGTVPAASVAPLAAVKGSSGTVVVTLWIGREDSILRRIEVVGPVGAGESAATKRTIEISRPDEPVTIEPPKGAA